MSQLSSPLTASVLVPTNHLQLVNQALLSLRDSPVKLLSIVWTGLSASLALLKAGSAEVDSTAGCLTGGAENQLTDRTVSV